MKVFEWFEARMDTLGERIGSPFNKLTDWMDLTLQTRITGAVEDVFEDFEQEMKVPLGPIFDDALKNPNLPTNVRKLIEEAREPQHFASAAILAAAAGIAIMPALGAAMSGGIEQIRQGSMSHFKPSLMNPDESISAFWRGILDSEGLEDELKQHGYNKERQDLLEQVRRYIPNPQDLIRFAVRDVFREDIVKEYGYDTDFDKILKELKPHLDSIGMDEDVMRLYWRAHWMLPSVSQAFEMLHRGEIELKDIQELLRISDVAPAWIDPLIKIAYSPYTRVDVRRMYDAGVLDKEAVRRAYTDIGYDDEHADNLTTWTVAESMSTEKDLSKTEIITAYVQGSISVGEAQSSLTDMGYDADEAELILAIQDYKTDNRVMLREKKILTNYFIRGDITIEELKDAYSKLGLSEKEINISAEEARNKVRAKVASPSKADLIKWLNAHVINAEDFMVEMRLKGYSTAHIKNYLAVEG